MRWIAARRRHPAARYIVLLLALVAAGAVYTVVTTGPAATSGGYPAGEAALLAAPSGATAAQRQDISEGQMLFQRTCAVCHGFAAQGTTNAPSLIGVGAAAVDFQMSTGRMPAKELGAEEPQKPPAFTTQQIHAIAEYISSLGGGPAIPSASQVSTAGADVALGQQLFITDCAQCHNVDGAGGALTYGKYAPALTQATPIQIYEAMQTGPEAMPVFNDTTITPENKRDIIAYITKVRSEPNPGGFSLGRIGPVTEGLVGWLGGIGVLIFAAMWITAKRRES